MGVTPFHQFGHVVDGLEDAGEEAGHTGEIAPPLSRCKLQRALHGSASHAPEETLVLPHDCPRVGEGREQPPVRTSPPFIFSVVDWGRQLGCGCFPRASQQLLEAAGLKEPWEVPSPAQVGGHWDSSPAHKRSRLPGQVVVRQFCMHVALGCSWFPGRLDSNNYTKLY